MSNTIDFSKYSNEQLQDMLTMLPKESEYVSKIKAILANSHTKDALVHLKDTLVNNSDSILKTVDSTVGKTVTIATKVTEVYGKSVFGFLDSIADSANRYMDGKLKTKAIRDEIVRRARAVDYEKESI